MSFNLKSTNKIIHRIGLTFLVLFPLLAFFGISYFSMQMVSSEKQPWVSWFADPAHEVYISWETESDTECYVQYGLSFDNLNDTVISSQITKIHHVNVTNLDANTQYFYKVYANGNEFGNGQFTTAPIMSNEEFIFAAFSDTQQPKIAPGAFNRVSKVLSTKNYRFFALIGDFVDEGTEKWQYDHFFSMGSTLFQTTPIVPVVGNHDRFGRNTSWFAPYFINHQNRSQFYYSFNYGNTHFTVCDYAFVNEGDIKVEQFAWLEDDLKNAQNQTFRVVMFHRPIATDGFHRSSSNLTTYVLPMLKEYNVHLVISGHEHSYQRLDMENITQLVVGTGGGAFDPGLIAHNSTIKDAVSHSYLECAVSQNTIICRCITLEGDIIDEFSISPTGAI